MCLLLPLSPVKTRSTAPFLPSPSPTRIEAPKLHGTGTARPLVQPHPELWSLRITALSSAADPLELGRLFTASGWLTMTLLLLPKNMKFSLLKESPLSQSRKYLGN